MLLQHLPISSINIADDSYRTTFAPRLEELKRSIRTVGLVQPITVRHTTEGTFQIITGYKRVLVMKELNRQSVPALVCEHNEIPPDRAFLMNFHDNAVRGEMNIIEKSNALAKLQQFCSLSEEELVTQHLPLLNEEPSYKILHQLLSLQALTEQMRHHVVTTDMALTSAVRIAEFTSTTQQSLLAVLSYIRPSGAKLNELLSLIREISARDGVSVESVLDRYKLLTIVADPDASQTEKVKALRQTLRGIRLPQLTERQNKLAELIQSLELPDHAKLITDPYFENQKFKLEYQFTQPEELNVLMMKIKGAFEKQQWQKIFDWYQA
ncbi:MAG: ParB N-terminal domain-containing protein [Deltaproteobacteria bacterium]|nr:ParB N-terminal domain-containing protein [Deltaproteobacteria bacterium]